MTTYSSHYARFITSLLQKHNISKDVIQYIENSVKIKSSGVTIDRFSIGISRNYLTKDFILDLLNLVPESKETVLQKFHKQINNPCRHDFLMFGNDQRDIEIYFEHLDSGESYDCGKQESSVYTTDMKPPEAYGIIKDHLPNQYFELFYKILPLNTCRLVYRKHTKNLKYAFLVRRMFAEPVNKFHKDLISLSKCVNTKDTCVIEEHLKKRASQSLEWIGLGIGHDNKLYLTYYTRPYTKCSTCN
jgi:hypothetical protein